jgi:hypothetical protein
MGVTEVSFSAPGSQPLEISVLAISTLLRTAFLSITWLFCSEEKINQTPLYRNEKQISKK